MSNKSSIVAVVPMKSLAESKTRLSPHLSPARRSALSLSMFSWVVQTLTGSRIARVIVVGGDSAVKAEAERGGAEWLKDEFLDLNKAISRVFDEIWEDGLSAAYVPARPAPADSLRH